MKRPTYEDMSEEEWLEIGVLNGFIYCANCGGQTCGACLFREMHDECDDDCPECCDPISESNLPATVRIGLLRPGWFRAWGLA